MKQRIIFLLLMAFSFSVVAQVPVIVKYKNLPTEVKDQVKRSVFNKAVDEYESDIKSGYNISVTPIDRVITDVQTVVVPRGIEKIELTGWDRDVLAPSNIYRRIGEEASVYNCVLVINDSGVDETHPVLAGDHWLTASNYSGDTEKHFHGTFVSGQAYKLIAPLIQANTVQMKSAQLLNRNGSGSFAGGVNLVETESNYFEPRADAGDGIVFCNSWGASIVPYQPLEQALQDNYHPNMFWVAAAGNSGGATESYPASSDYMLSVPALTRSLTRASYSTIADWNFLSAPGSGVTSTMPGGQMGTGNGTSYAAPLVAAEVVIAYGKYGPKLSGNNMEVYLAGIATDISPSGLDRDTGHGLAFVQAILDTDPCDVPGVDCSGTTPPDGPNPPTPDPSLYFSAGIDDTGFMIPWRREADKGFSYLYVPSIKFHTVGDAGEQEAHQRALQFISDFFQSRAIVLTDDMDWYSATKWTGRFMNLIAANEGVELEVQEITGKDMSGSGLTYYANDFTWTPSDIASQMFGVRLIDRE